MSHRPAARQHDQQLRPEWSLESCAARCLLPLPPRVVMVVLHPFPTVAVTDLHGREGAHLVGRCILGRR